MSRQFGAGYSYHSGCGGSDRTMVGILTDRELAARKVDHALIGVLEPSGWRPEIRMPWSGIGACRVELPAPAWVVVGHSGRALVVDALGHREETIGTGAEAAARIGLLRGARAIGGRAHAVGMERQAWRREAAGQWTAIDAGLRLPPGDPAITGLEAIDGFGPDELWAVGWRGEVWRLRDGSWRLLPSPTNLILTNLCCAGDGVVYVCGRRGLLLRAEGDRIAVIEQDLTRDDFWGIAWHEGSVWLATFYALYRYLPREDRLLLVDEEDAPDSCYHLNAVEGRLWSFGPFEVAVRESGGWAAID